jgi:glycosyltransferase involved in cell wall biosynthesis
MVTRNRLTFVKRAVRAFEQQTHTHRELVILDDGQDGTADFINSLRESQIRYIRPETDDLTLGELRNIAIEKAQGAFVTQWDDDDWYHPDRIRVQLAALRYTQSQFCFLSRWTLCWPARHLFLHSKQLCWEGSILGSRAAMPAYPPLKRGEDSALVQQILNSQARVCFVDNPDLYVYIVHGENTYGEDHFSNNIFLEHTARLTDDQVGRLKRELEMDNEA